MIVFYILLLVTLSPNVMFERDAIEHVQEHVSVVSVANVTFLLDLMTFKTLLATFFQ